MVVGNSFTEASTQRMFLTPLIVFSFLVWAAPKLLPTNVLKFIVFVLHHHPSAITTPDLYCSELLVLL